MTGPRGVSAWGALAVVTLAATPGCSKPPEPLPTPSAYSRALHRYSAHIGQTGERSCLEADPCDAILATLRAIGKDDSEPPSGRQEREEDWSLSVISRGDREDSR